MSSFDELLADLEAVQEMKKSIPSEQSEGEESELLGKSFEVTNENGEKMEAVDGTELVKSLIAQIDEFKQEKVTHEAGLMKSLGVMSGLLKDQATALKEQSDMIKSLQAEVATMRGEGRGRKSVVSVMEKPSTQMTKSQQEGPTAEEFMMKAASARDAGRLTAIEMSTIELSLQKSVPIDKRLINKIMQ